MNAIDTRPEAVFGRRWDDAPTAPDPNREGLALVMLDRIIKAEGGEPDQNIRTYLLDLLREILLTVDGKRAPPLVIPTVDRRHA